MSTNEPTLVSVVMPALNEADNVKVALDRIPVAELAAIGYQTEIIVVDNGSEDGTAELARQAGARVVTEPHRGYGHAYKCGFAEAKGDVICAMDADGTYPAEILPELVTMLPREDLDFISTDRFASMTNGVMSRRNKWGNNLLTLASRVLFQVPFRDSQSGMWVFRSALLDDMRLSADGMALSEEIKIEAAWRLKARCAEVSIDYGYRRGDSKLRVWRDGVGNLYHLARQRLSAQRPTLHESRNGASSPAGVRDRASR